MGCDCVAGRVILLAFSGCAGLRIDRRELERREELQTRAELFTIPPGPDVACAGADGSAHNADPDSCG